MINTDSTSSLGLKGWPYSNPRVQVRAPEAGSWTWGSEWTGDMFPFYWERLELKDQAIVLTRWPRPMLASRRGTACVTRWRMCNPTSPLLGTLCSETQTFLQNKQVRHIKLKSFCTAKKNHQQNEKATYRMRENICKSYLC